MKNIMIFILTGLMIQLTPVVSMGNVSKDGADFLVSIGEQRLKAGQIEEALHEFSKALMIHPENKKAKKYLAQYGFNEGLYSGTRTAASDRAELANELKGVNENVRVMALEQKEREEDVRSVHAQKEAISKELTNKNKEVYELKDEVATLRETLLLKDDVIAQKSKKREMIQHEMQTASIDRLGEAEALQIPVKKLGMVHEYENELLRLQAKNNKLRENNIVKSRQYSNLHSKVESYALVRSQVIEDYKDESISKDIEILDNQHQLIKTLDDVDHMYDVLKIQRDRIDQRYDSIKEKNIEAESNS